MTPSHPKNVSALSLTQTRQQHTPEPEAGALEIQPATAPAGCRPSPAGLHLHPPASCRHRGPSASHWPVCAPAPACRLKTGAEPAAHLVFIKAPRHCWLQARPGSRGIHPSLGSKNSHRPAGETCRANKGFRRGRLGAEGPPSPALGRVWTPPHQPCSCYITAPRGARGCHACTWGCISCPGRAAVGSETVGRRPTWPGVSRLSSEERGRASAAGRRRQVRGAGGNLGAQRAAGWASLPSFSSPSPPPSSTSKSTHKRGFPGGAQPSGSSAARRPL